MSTSFLSSPSFFRRLVALAAAGGCAALPAGCTGSFALPVQKTQAPYTAFAARPPSGSLKFTFTTLDDPHDPTFNRLLGINNEGKIGGYYGSGGSGHPNRGYIIRVPYQQTDFKDVDYPNAADTVVTSLNNTGDVIGYYVDTQGKIAAFLWWENVWFVYEDQHAGKSNAVTELFGINDAGIGVGFSKNGPTDFAVKLNDLTGRFYTIKTPHGEGAVATGISGLGHIVGFLKKSKGYVGMLIRNGVMTEFSYPHSTSTQALGVTTYDRVVGSYVDTKGATHGFMVTNPAGKAPVWQSIDDPNAKGGTVVSAINVHDDIVGYYIDASGNNHGFLGKPSGVR